MSEGTSEGVAGQPSKLELTEYDGHLSWGMGKHVKINTAWKPRGQRISLPLLTSMSMLEK